MKTITGVVPEERRKRAIYITPLTRSSICTMKRMIGRAPLVLSHWRTLSPIIWSFVQSYRIILQHSLALSHIEARHIAIFIAFTSQNDRSESCELRVSNFSYAILLPTVYKPYLIILVARMRLLVRRLWKGFKIYSSSFVHYWSFCSLFHLQNHFF